MPRAACWHARPGRVAVAEKMRLYAFDGTGNEDMDGDDRDTSRDGTKRTPVIRFLGLWDLVASFGIPGNKINLGYQLTVPAVVEHCYHRPACPRRRDPPIR